MMEPKYNHSKYEEGVYQTWEECGAFSPLPPQEARKKKLRPFTIIMPPPNANDPLHVGHAMFITVEDILIRFHRMLGDNTLWLPGTDHAGIETQYVYEKKLNKAGKSRFSYDRETLYQMIWDYVAENSETALRQMKKLGASADWSRTTFTLDPRVVDLVLKTFERMHQDGLIYRGLRLVNYCPKCGTGYSELEVKYVERKDPLYYIQYGPFELATVRPETKFGDTAVAVNPKDSRYKTWVGKEIEVEGLLGKFRLKVIADGYVDPEFGTGVVKITPAHDPNDFEVGQRHKLAMKQVIGYDGKLTEAAGKYQGLKVAEARKRVVEDLKSKNLITKVDEAYTHNVATCYRCGSMIEPLPLPQFFINVKPLTETVLAAMKQKRFRVHGAGHDKILMHWLTHLKDWNISRQIVWGIRMPVWYQVGTIEGKEQSPANQDIMVGFINQEKQFVSGKIGELLKTYPFKTIEQGLQTLQAPAEAEYVISREEPGDHFLQETDTFDTWFSSAQWPVVTLLAQGKKTSEANILEMRKLPYSTEAFDYFYPTQVMETGYDILPFWVMRMLMMGFYLTGQTPFEEIYLHGLVRDEKGLKMSKSKGNVINPLDLVEKYGADALRMALVMSTTAGHDSAVGENKVRGMRNLTNKLWNAARFIQLQNNGQTSNKNDEQEQWYWQTMAKTVEDVTKQITEFKIGLAAETVHNAFWHFYCDEAIEKVKTGQLSLASLKHGLGIFLKLLHPFIPFVTETLWQELRLGAKNGLLIRESWPNSKSLHETQNA